MIDRIMIMSTLYLFHENKSPVTNKRIRHGRVILSLFKEDLVPEDEYFQTIEELSNEGYIDINGSLIEDCTIVVNRKGGALVHSLGERIIGQTDFDRLRGLMQEYINEPSEYTKKVGERLKTLQKKRREKIMETDPEPIRAVGMLLKLIVHDKDVFLHQFKLDGEIMKNTETLDWEVVSLKNQLMAKMQNPVHAYREDNLLVLVVTGELNTITFCGKELNPDITEKVNQTKIDNWPATVLSFLMEKWLRKIGYVRARQKHHVFTKFNDYKISDTKAGLIKEHDTINLNYGQLENDFVFVWINNYSSFFKSALDFLLENNVNLEQEDPMMQFLKDVKLRIIPSLKVLELKGIIPNINVREEKIKGLGQTYAEFWKKKYDVDLTHAVQPIFLFKGWGNDLNYPAETVSIDRYYLEKRFEKLHGRNPKHESPKERVKRVKELSRSLKSVKGYQLADFIEVEVEEACPSAKRLLDLGAFEEIIKISPPLLEFARGEVRLDPMDIFYDNNTEPACGKKNLNLSHFIAPLELEESEADRLISSLNERFRNYGFGTINKDPNLTVIKYNQESEIQELEGRIRDLDKIERNGRFGIAVIPDESSIHYYSLKRLFPARTGVPLQGIQMSSCRDILEGTFKGAQFLSLKMLIKSLEEGEAIWTLTNSAGLSSEKSLFVGIGFSRFPREGKVSKCAAVMHGPHGDLISWKVFPTTQERTITKQWFDNLLFRIREIVERERPTRLVFYRTGTLYPIEATAINNSLVGCHWLSHLKTSLVSIIDGKDYRFCMAKERCENIPAGYCIILNSNEALLSTSNYDERKLNIGTVIPMILKVEFGEDDIRDIAKEYHDLTYLNWRSPITTPKLPFVVKIAERLAELNREGVPVENMFYLDL
ncbi:MAG: Piwi domain-containing protein [Halobacteriota archaeon]|nr:Piwi domain-containing protein [Halobacteriota archaeon]